MEGCGNAEFRVIEGPVAEKHLPLGDHMNSETSPVLGDVVESWNFLCSVKEVLGLEITLSLEQLMTGLSRVPCVGLIEAQVKMLQVLLAQLKVGPKRRRRSNTGSSTATERAKYKVPIINELTWPEVARRYALVFHSLKADFVSAEDSLAIEVLSCLQGDGGRLCASVTGHAKLKVDTWLLVAAMTKIFGSSHCNNDTLIIDAIDYENRSSNQDVAVNERVPAWVEELKPIKGLKTNVGSRIRTCIEKSMQKCPPKWAIEKLKCSISKEVYKSNACGPTKSAALDVIAHFYTGTRESICISDIVQKKCCIVLRKTAAAFFDLARVKSTLCGEKVGHCQFFVMIDLRLARGVYCGSHQAFAEDVREIWRDLPHAFDDLRKDFESSYQKEVVAVQQRLSQYKTSGYSSANAKEYIKNVFISANENPKAPWEGLCMECYVDERDDDVLLCDGCDEKYHTFCLSPALTRVPEGDWFCPCCIAGKDFLKDALPIRRHKNKKKKGEAMKLIPSEFAGLVAMLQKKNYWELSTQERTLLLKVFCDKFLNSACVRKLLEDRRRNKQPKSSFRSDYAGIDSSGKLYWIMGSGTDPWIIVNERNKFNQNDAKCPSTIEEIHGDMSLTYTSWACYQGDLEDTQSFEFLKDDEFKGILEKKLPKHKRRHPVPNASTSHDLTELQQSLIKFEDVFVNSSTLMTRATEFLESKYDRCVKLQTSNLWKDVCGKEKVYRCQCLELILPAELHCDCCHITFITKDNFQLHNGGRCGTASTMPSKFNNSSSTLIEEGTSVSVNEAFTEGNEKKKVGISGGMEQGDNTLKLPQLEIDNFFKQHEQSARPLTGKAYEVLTRLKINLLDMEAALSGENVRSSKKSRDKRLAWRAFVKSARTIYEMVQATIVLEEMIDKSYLDLSWCRSSSWSAAATISTLAGLSFRIYSLDAAIKYE